MQRHNLPLQHSCRCFNISACLDYVGSFRFGFMICRERPSLWDVGLGICMRPSTGATLLHQELHPYVLKASRYCGKMRVCPDLPGLGQKPYERGRHFPWRREHARRRGAWAAMWIFVRAEEDVCLGCSGLAQVRGAFLQCVQG